MEYSECVVCGHVVANVSGENGGIFWCKSSSGALFSLSDFCVANAISHVDSRGQIPDLDTRICNPCAREAFNVELESR